MKRLQMLLWKGRSKMATARLRGSSYEIRVSCGLDSRGKRLYEYMHWTPEPGMTPKQIEKELERQKVLFENKVRKGEVVSSNIYFRDFSARWMEDYAKQRLAPKTFYRYGEYLQRINTAIGHIKLADLRPTHLNTFYKNLMEPGTNKKGKRDKHGELIELRPLAPKTVLDHHRLISKILNTAVRWELLDRNVAERADPPKLVSQERECLDEANLKKLLFLLNREPMQYRAMITLLIYTGMRRGELCGLEWKDIDFEHQTLSICRSSQYLGGGNYITKEPKTKAGIRKMTIGPGVCQMLRQYQQYQNQQKEKAGDCWQETDRLFTQWDGRPIHPDTISGWFPKFLERCDLPKVTLHSLRHSNATIMIAEGVDIRTVSNRLGHAHTSTTLNIYTHALKTRDQDAADKLDAAFNF